MFARALGVTLRRTAIARASRRCAHDAGHDVGHYHAPNWPEKFRAPHMDELPVPKGSWKESFDKSNGKHTRNMLVGIAFFLATVSFIYIDQPIDLVLAPPKSSITSLPDKIESNF